MITITKLRKALQKDDNLKKLRDNFYYLLADYEKKVLNGYLRDYRLAYYKKEFIRNFVNRLKNTPVERQKEIIDLISKKLNLEPDHSLQVSMFDFTESLSKPIKPKPEGFSRDAYFNDLVEHENYEELHNLYGIREIERDSNLLDGESK